MKERENGQRGWGGGYLREAIIWGMAIIRGNKVTDTLSTTSFKKNPRFHPISHHDDKI